MYLYGAGGHAKVIIDILRNSHQKINGFFDDNPDIKEFQGIKVLHDCAMMDPEVECIISIGDNHIRSKVAISLKRMSFGNAVHGSAIISQTSGIGQGTVVMHGAIVQADTKIGTHVIVNTKVSVDHDCHVGNFVHLAPGSTIAGRVTIGEGTIIGAGAVICPGVNIGKWCKVGAGAVVLNDVPDDTTISGNPAAKVVLSKIP